MKGDMHLEDIFGELKPEDFHEIEDPAFANSAEYQLCDWRNYIHENIRRAWVRLSTFERLSLFLNAKALAQDKVITCKFRTNEQGQCLTCQRERVLRNAENRNHKNRNP